MTERPRLLDLYCGEGGIARGYVAAGFDVVGVDLHNQSHFPGQEPMLKNRTPHFTFKQADAFAFLESPCFDLWGFSAIHASPPCQAYSITKHTHKVQHPDLLAQTRELLKSTGLPYVIENVVGAPMDNPVTLCGASFDLTAEDDNGEPLILKRHRQFEATFSLRPLPCKCKFYKDHLYKIGGVSGGGSKDRAHAENVRHGGYTPSKAVQEKLMGIDWMTQKGLNQAIPPSYGYFIGKQLIQHLDSTPSSSAPKEPDKCTD